jgi:tRNA(Ile)-lysidine synthase
LSPLHSFESRFQAALERCLSLAGRPVSGLCVALSGGLDSTVLLAAVAGPARTAHGLPVRVLHVDHALHPDSERWSEACLELSERHAVPCAQLRVDARAARGESPEAAARAARYAAFAANLADSEMLLTAHHADDQLETILLQWLRGGGLRALAGMPRLASFAGGWQGRPLLGFTRAEIRAWAVDAGLAWLEDPSNLDTRYDRNYLRKEVLPPIRRRWPAAARTVARVAEYAAEAVESEDEQSERDLRALAEGLTLPVSGLAGLPLPRQLAVLRCWLRAQDLPVPSAATLGALRDDMLRASVDRNPCTNWAGAEVRRYRGRLFASPGGDAAGVLEGPWSIEQPFALPDGGRLELRAGPGPGLSRGRLPRELEVRLRRGGEKFQPRGSVHRKDLRKWLQEQGVLPWLRSRIPLICSGGEIVAIGDLALSEAYFAAAGEPAWQLVWHGRPLLTEQQARATPLGGNPASQPPVAR